MNYIQGRHGQFSEGKASTVAATSAACHHCRPAIYSAKSREGLGLRGLASRDGPDIFAFFMNFFTPHTQVCINIIYRVADFN